MKISVVVPVGQNRLFMVANLLAAADELVAVELASTKVPSAARARLLKLELEHVLEHARQLAGLVPSTAKQKRGGP